VVEVRKEPACEFVVASDELELAMNDELLGYQLSWLDNTSTDVGPELVVEETAPSDFRKWLVSFEKSLAAKADWATLEAPIELEVVKVPLMKSTMKILRSSRHIGSETHTPSQQDDQLGRVADSSIHQSSSMNGWVHRRCPSVAPYNMQLSVVVSKVYTRHL